MGVGAIEAIITITVQHQRAMTRRSFSIWEEKKMKQTEELITH